MASTSALGSELNEMQLSDPCCTAGASMESEFHTALQPQSGRVCLDWTLRVWWRFMSALGSVCGKCSSDVERDQRIEKSKVHWSEVSEASFDPAIEEDNRKVFRELQSHPTWHPFFRTFGYDFGVPYPGRPGRVRGSSGELVLGKKFAEGGQAELFHARVIWRNPKGNEDDEKEGTEWVVKVFKKGTSLRQLQVQWPHGYLQYVGEMYSTPNYPDFIRWHCEVRYGVLLKDGRFAFLMVREHEDLRCLIEKRMLEVGEERGPFTKEEGEEIMYRIAKGMEWLHEHNIVHRDLKASNVLVSKNGAISVADFECSIGVVGTGFWRAPEILQAIKDKKVGERPEVFSREADVYAYGMTCYEILTGKLPFATHPVRHYSIVLNGGRPDLPKYVEDWMCDLLRGCWKHDPKERPSFKDILNIFVTYSPRVRDYLESQRTRLENMRNKEVE